MSVPPTCPAEPITSGASFGEPDLDIEFSHDGDMIELSDRRPCDAEIRDSEDGLRHLTGFMPTRNAERFDGLETEIGICNYLLNVSESK